MGGTKLQSTTWTLANRQHGVVSRAQLLALGFSRKAIEHRIATGRLHPLWRGVYAVGRPEVTRYGRWMAAVLTCGPGAGLSHEGAGALWEIRWSERIEVTVPPGVYRSRPGIVVHRRRAELTRSHGIPVTTPIETLIDLAAGLERDELEAAVNQADKLDLVDPERVRSALDDPQRGRPGVAPLRETLDRRTYSMTDSQLERLLLPIARRVGLERPQTQVWVNGFRVDFYWPELGLVVETDGLRYHRTPAEQARDRIRDQVHTAAGLTPLRFTRAQVRFEPAQVGATLGAVARRLRPARAAA